MEQQRPGRPAGIGVVVGALAAALCAACHASSDMAQPQSLCGLDNMQAVNAYDGSLGEPVAFVRQHKFPVGALADGDDAMSSKYCSGTLIGPSLFITAGHCVDASTVGRYVVFNYELAADGTTPLAPDYYEITGIAEDGGNLDYSILQLAGAPGRVWGWETVRTTLPATGALLTVIQHPTGLAKAVAVGPVTGYGNPYLSYGVDTLDGSSGAGLLDAQGDLIGVHTDAGCTSSGGSNAGVPFSEAPATSMLAKLGAAPSPFTDGRQLILTIPVGTARLVLAADLAQGTVSLASALPSVRLAPPLTTTWQAADLHDGSFSLTAVLAGSSAPALLAAHATTDDVSLVAAPDAVTFGTRWRVLADGASTVLLRDVGAADGPHWLLGSPTALGLGASAAAETAWQLYVEAP